MILNIRLCIRLLSMSVLNFSFHDNITETKVQIYSILLFQQLYNIWKSKDLRNFKQRPALQNLREDQLALQVVALHNKFYSQNIVILLTQIVSMATFWREKEK